MNKPEHAPKHADLSGVGSNFADESPAPAPVQAPPAAHSVNRTSSFSPSLLGTEESLQDEMSNFGLDKPIAHTDIPLDQRSGWMASFRRYVSHPWLTFLHGVGLLRVVWRRWIRHHPGVPSRALETLLWPLVFVLLAWYSNPANPFYIDEGFPWPWLGPWLIGLRYGVGYGVAAALGLLGAWALFALPEFPRLYFLGGAIMTLIAGEFGSYWRMHVLRLQESMHFLNDKVERLTRRLYLVKLSHDELEYEMVDRPGTLRESLIELRVLMNRHSRENPHEEAGLPGAQYMLDFMVQHCRIESAAMYSVRMDPTIQLTRVAVAGRMRDPASDDPMVVRALESGHQVHLQDALMESATSNQLIAATPLISSHRQPFGLVAIGNMPFTALTTDNLQTMAVLVESYADYLRLSLNAAVILHQWPDAPLGLAGEFAWLARLFNEFGLASRCVVWRVHHAREQEMLGEVLELHSRGETAWRWPQDRKTKTNNPCVIALVPFSDAPGVSLYKQRIFDSMDRSFGDLGADQLSAYDFAIGRENSFSRLRWLVESDELNVVVKQNTPHQSPP